MGKRDSSKTRVVPVFDRLYENDKTGCSWLPRLIKLPVGGHKISLSLDCRFTIKEHGWGDDEKKLDPPVALLSWLIRNLEYPKSGDLSADKDKAEKRNQLIKHSSDTIRDALSLLRNNPKGEEWHILEGQTQPDVYIETDDLIVVIEGKRTEKEPTTTTKWMERRNQMLRHLDCAWEIRGDKQLVGFFIVEGNGEAPDIPSSQWLDFAANTICPATITSSLPHRGQKEQQGINSCFLGVTTWQRVCEEFGIDFNSLPDVID